MLGTNLCGCPRKPVIKGHTLLTGVMLLTKHKTNKR